MFLVITITFQNTVYIILHGQNSVPKPQVLGEQTSVRGSSTDNLQSKFFTKISEPDFEEISAKSFLVYDISTGQVLAKKQSQLKLPIASLTKLLSSLVAYENVDLNKEFTIVSSDTNIIKPNLNLSVGDKVKALDLFNSMLVGSSNDSSTALANYVSRITGRSFVDLMNELAKSLQMDNSNFSNPLGFDSQYNYSTAEDLQKLINTTQKLAVYKNLSRRTNYEFTSALGKKYFIKATNKLISTHPEVEAIKTGYTDGSKGSMATKIKIIDNNIVIIVLGSENRDSDTIKLKNIILNNFRLE